MKTENLKKLNQHINKKKYDNYPIKNILLENESDYIKNNYFKMLAVILQQGNEITEVQTIFYKRMLAGVKNEYVIEDYLRQALEIEINEFIDFTNQCSDMVLKYRFIIDAILLICCDKKDDKQIELAVSFMEFLKLKKEEIEYLSKLCKGILEQDSEAYWETEISDIKINDLLYNHIGTYIDDFVKDIEVINENEIKVLYKNKKDIVIDKFVNEDKIIDDEKVIFKNVRFNLSQNKLKFLNNIDILFKDCEFINGCYQMFNGDCCIYLTNCKKVTFENCIFKDFTYRVLIEESINEVHILECKFENCIFRYSDCFSNLKKHVGGVIYTENYSTNGQNYINNTYFYKCGTSNCFDYDKGENAISNCKINVKNCKFEKCWNWYNDESNKSSTTLFLEGTTNDNNILEDCADFS